MKPKDQSSEWRRKRMEIRNEYMELALYPDQYRGTEKERLDRLEVLREQIKKFRYKSIRNFVNEVFDDCMNGIIGESPTQLLLKYLRGHRDKIEWVAVTNSHMLIVNGENSPDMDISKPAEVGGYMAFYINPRKCRILRVFDVTKFRVIE